MKKRLCTLLVLLFAFLVSDHAISQTEFFYDHTKGALRSGVVDASQTIGFYSNSWGYNNSASCSYCTAWGLNSRAQGNGSTAWGFGTSADGDYSTTWGLFTIASGDFTTASGEYTTARSYLETVFGTFNTEYTLQPGGATGWRSQDRLFVIGNGNIDGLDVLKSDALVILKNGNTGLGVSKPSTRLQVSGTGAAHGGVSGFEEVISLFKNTKASTHSALSIDALSSRDAIIYYAENGQAKWNTRHDASSDEFQIGYNGGVSANLTKLRMNTNGDVTITGTLSQSSDFNKKENIVDANLTDILNKVTSLPISEWQYIDHPDRHIGPMAQDFYAAFGLGQGETTIAAIDADGIALAAIKAQQVLIEELYNKILKLENRINQLED